MKTPDDTHTGYLPYPSFQISIICGDNVDLVSKVSVQENRNGDVVTIIYTQLVLHCYLGV